jgi:phosphatidylglycerophosphatase A
MRTLALVVATVGGIGRAPVASGTFGSLAAVPLLPVLATLRTWSPAGYAVVLVALVLVAVWAAGLAEEVLGGHDHSQIVIDEVAGLVMAGIFLPGTWLATGIAFFLFRLFDILKPFPAGLIDRRATGGVGVVGDDLVAGIYAGLVGRVVLALVR